MILDSLWIGGDLVYLSPIVYDEFLGGMYQAQLRGYDESIRYRIGSTIDPHSALVSLLVYPSHNLFNNLRMISVLSVASQTLSEGGMMRVPQVHPDYGPYYLIRYQGYIYALSQHILHARLTVS
jgi:hypothetical protein